MYLVLLALCLCGTIPAARAADAILLTPHPAGGDPPRVRAEQAHRSRRGKRVRGVKVQGDPVDIETKGGETLSVPLKNLQMLPGARPVVAVPDATP